MKRCLLFSSLILAASARPEFDLQLEGRFNPIGPARASFTRMVPDGANGFYAAGWLAWTALSPGSMRTSTR